MPRKPKDYEPVSFKLASPAVRILNDYARQMMGGNSTAALEDILTRVGGTWTFPEAPGYERPAFELCHECPCGADVTNKETRLAHWRRGHYDTLKPAE